MGRLDSVHNRSLSAHGMYMMRRNMRSTPVIWAVTFILVLLIAGCIGPRKPPERPDNICEIFREHKDWYKDAYDSYERWRVPIPVMMAIMHQESRFNAKIQPPRTTCLWIFPGPRPSSAYGYSQALDATWEKYTQSSGNSGADRDEFDDAVDFIGWYCYTSHVKCKIARADAYNLYLAYHEGHGGYLRKTYNSKPWLLRVAQNVKQRARTYQSQLASCEREFKRRGCCLWPF
jgi:hypothetical protein